MATFSTPEQVRDFKTYKAGMKTALARLHGDTATKYVYFHQFKFDDKTRALLLVDFEPALPKTLGSAISEGKCKMDEHDRFVFEGSKGEVNVDKVASLFADIGIARAVARPGEGAPTASAKPVAEKLDMKYGWTEIRTWGADAAELIERFDGLLGLYKGLPEIPPDAKDLHDRHESIKTKMADLAKTRISNTDADRGNALKAVNSLREAVEALNNDARRPKPAPKSTTVPVEPASTTARREPEPGPAKTEPASSKPQPKPELTAELIKEIVRSTRPVGKDDADKYTERLKRKLPSEYSGITDKHYEAIKKLAEVTYFKASKAEPEPVVAKGDDGPTPLTDTQARNIDAAIQAAIRVSGQNDTIDNDAQVALGDAITHAIGGSNPTHSRGGGHRGSFNKDVTIQQALSNIGRILNPKTRASINAHLQGSGSPYNV